MSAYVKPECDSYLQRFYDGMGYGYYGIGEEYTVFCTEWYNAAENKIWNKKGVVIIYEKSFNSRS